MTAPTSTPADLLTLLGEFLMLVSETRAYHRHKEVQAVLDDAANTLMRLHHRTRLASRPYVVAVVGLTNVGKSTLLNALLGPDLAPRRNGPCTAAPVEFKYGEAWSVVVHHQGRLHQQRFECSGATEIREKLETLVDDPQGEESQSIRKVEVQLPIPLLQQGLVIADTPGFGAAQPGDGPKTHEDALQQYLKTDVSQVFWVVWADQGISQREQTSYNRNFARVCDDIVVNVSEDWDLSDRLRFQRRFSKLFEKRLPAFHFVSGLKGLQARQVNDAAALEAAGIPELERRVTHLADPAMRADVAANAVVNLARALRDWLKEFRDERDRPLETWWRPDSWHRWVTFKATHNLAVRITPHLEQQ